MYVKEINSGLKPASPLDIFQFTKRKGDADFW
jgi:hypothetical protein